MMDHNKCGQTEIQFVDHYDTLCESSKSMLKTRLFLSCLHQKPQTKYFANCQTSQTEIQFVDHYDTLCETSKSLLKKTFSVLFLLKTES